MEDKELEAIRQARLQQLKSNPNNSNSDNNDSELVDEGKRLDLARILEPSAYVQCILLAFLPVLK